MSLRRTRDKNTLASRRGSTSSLYRGTLPPCVTPRFIQTRQQRQGLFIVCRGADKRESLVSHASVPRMRRTLRTKCFFHIRHKTIIGPDARDITMRPARAIYASPR